MITIIHGNDLVSSRDYFSKEKGKSESPILINGDGLGFDQLFQASENKTFFENKVALAIENFFSKNNPQAVVIYSKPGARSDLGRPTTGPIDNKKEFMNFLSES
jgi:hypothetical protein